MDHEIPGLASAERARILHQFNNTAAPYPQSKLIHQLFEEQVERAPLAVAVICGTDKLTYQELNRKANRLARALRDCGVGPHRTVALLAERGTSLVVGMLGILKAGAAYIPLDPQYPADRLAYMVDDSAPNVLLTQASLQGKVSGAATKDLVLESAAAGSGPADDENLPLPAGSSAGDMVYVIYTSGSTGAPKGVMVSHRSLANLITWHCKEFEVSAGSRCSSVAAVGFDASAWEIWPALSAGATLVLAPAALSADPGALISWWANESLDVSFLPTPLAELAFNQGVLNRRLRTLLVGGDRLRNRIEHQPARLINNYGPTECTVVATSGRISADDADLHIGRPIANTQIYILDESLQPVPVGIAGEVYIGGAGVALGYLNRPELTAQRFIKDSFSSDPHARLYRSGDLARWREDGTIEFLGRNDHQVKIRGFRIELGEIEAQLARHPFIKEAVVIAREDLPGQKRLVAYLTLREPDSAGTANDVATVDLNELRSSLKSTLPDYMVPSAFVTLQVFPLTPNGKLDRRALPAPDLSAYLNREYEPPQGEVEELLAAIWQDLLHVPRVGRQDNFFELGGHSVLMVQMMARLRHAKLSAEVRSVFQSPTLAELAQVVTREAYGEAVEVPSQVLPLVELETRQIEQITACVPGGAANIQDIYPLAPLQQGILFHHLLNRQQGGDAYVVSVLLSLGSRDRLESLIGALQHVVDRHDVLRTAVLWEQLPQAVQVVYRHASLPVEEVTLDLQRDPLEQLKELASPDRQRMDLRQAPLMRLRMTSDPHNGRYLAILQLHHIVCDQESIDLLLAEVMAILRGHADELPEPIPYRNHVAQSLTHARTHDAEAFFRGKLADVDEPTAPFGLLDVHGDGSCVDEVQQPLDTELSARLRIQARRLGVSAATLFHAIWALVVAHTSRRDDVICGSVLLGRLQGSAGAQRIPGMFINTLPLRLRLKGLSAKELVEQTQRELIELLGHEQAPLAVAQRCSNLTGTLPLFTTLLNYRHSGADRESQLSWPEDIQPLGTEASTNYPIVLSIDDRGADFNLTAQVTGSVNSRRLLGYVQTATRSLVDALERQSHSLALDLPILPEEERVQIVRAFNETQTAYPHDRLVHELFEEQARRTPQAIAAVGPNESLTYQQLDAKATQLALHLLERGVQPDECVPIVLPRSVEMLVAQLAVLKSAGVYVPIDPALPVERQVFMIRDCGAQRVVCEPGFRNPLTEEGAVEVIHHCGGQASSQRAPLRSPRSKALGPRPAYVMYTSGSTGTPKGVVVPHHAISRLVLNNTYAPILPSDCVAHSSNPAFDASTFEVWGALLNGARVAIVPHPVLLEGERLAAFLVEQKVTVLWLTIGLFVQYAEALAPAFPQLRYVITGGDVMEPRVARRVLRGAPPQRLLNAYGPTECTTFSTTYHVESVDENTRSIPIGKPISNAQVYILDERLQPAPIGAAGEIYIGGAGVALGYLNRPELTAERFINDPFSSNPHARLYRSGDLGRWREDGNIEFLGRNDHQVKIRGFRIELGEIGAQLVRHPGIKEAVVIAREDLPGQKRLVAYFTLREVVANHPDPASGIATINIDELRSHLKSVLPDYMVPSAFVTLDAFPLTPNGKLDRRALPAPDLGAYLNREYEPPRGEVEQLLAVIWQDLLRVPRVGRQDNFFELGGHSLLIMQMMERLRHSGLSAEVRCVFQSPTLAELAQALSRESGGEVEAPPNLIPPGCPAITPQMLPLVELEPRQIEQIVHCVPGGVANIQDIYPLAPLQEGILFHHLLNRKQGGDAYVLSILLSLTSRDKLERLIDALQQVVDRHDVLRTAVLWEQLPRAVQVVYREASLPVEEVTLDPNRDPLAQLKERMTPEHLRLDLRKAPLMRVRVTSGPQPYAMLQLHHLVCDHESMDIMLAEVIAILRGQGPDLPKPRPCRNHVAQSLAHTRSHDAEAFFRSKLADVDEPTAPFGLLDVHGDGSRVDQVSEPVDDELSLRIRAQSRRMGVSSATFFHSVWALVVAHTSRRDDVVYGSVLLGRLQGSAGAQGVLGMFINTLPLRVRLQTVSARQLVEHTQRELIDLLGHEQASLAVAQRCSNLAGSPLFTTLLNYRHSALNLEGELATVAGASVVASRDWTNYPLMLSVDDLGAGFSLTLDADRQLDPVKVMGYVQTAIRSLLDSLEREPETPALRLPILPKGERLQILQSFNATQTPYPRGKLVHELFEEQVIRTPTAVAAIYGRQALTYQDLNSRANQLARHLSDLGAGPDQLVGICLERSLEMVIGLLGILKSGAAYLPLDPNYPPERLQHMLQDGQPRLIVTQEKLLARLPPENEATLVILERTQKDIESSDDSDFSVRERRLTSQQLVYVIYTSGSTGRPKGTAMAHSSMVNLIEWHRRTLASSDPQRVLQFAALSFDVAFQEIFSTLCLGNTLVLLDEWVRRDARALTDLLHTHSINRLFLPPLMLQTLAEYARSAQATPPGALRDIVTAGEQLRVSPEIVEYFDQLNGCRLHNHYGPTETHVVTSLTLSGSAREWPALPTIGTPIANAQIFILDSDRQPVPIGVAGEIYIGGAGVARGYLRRPELTAERFIKNPLTPEAEGVLYKTGDLARWQPDGTIEYLGRNDEQVKIRGFRIELGEIEAQLALDPQVKEAAVIAREDLPGQKRLVAYLTVRGAVGSSPTVNIDELRSHLKSALPDYMVPSAFVTLDALPISPNGKLDRRALPAPDLGSYVSREFEPPQGEIEELLAVIWQDILRLPRVGRRDNFFELGGHSLLIVQMLERLRRRGLSAEVRSVFQSPTLADLARVLAPEAGDESAVPPILIPPGCQSITPEMLPLVELERRHIEQIAATVPGGAANIQDIYPLAPLQEGILFHHLLNERGDVYIVPTLLSLSSREKLESLIGALQQVVDRHDVLRTAILWEELPRPVQVVYRRAALPVEHVTLDPARDTVEQLKERMSPDRQWLDLRKAPLIHLQVATDPRTSQCYAMMQLHHIVCDHESMDIMLEEVMAISEGHSQDLPEPVAYRNHVAQALAHARKHDAEAFFRAKLAEVDETTAPFGLLDVRGDGSNINQSHENLEPEVAQRLRAHARRLGVSAATFFHAVWGLVVAHTSRREDVVYGTLLLGRLQGSAGAQRILGMFINTLPLRLKLQGITAKKLLEHTQRELIELLGHEQASLAGAQRCSSVSPTAPLFTALLNYRHSAPNLDAELLRTAGAKVEAILGLTNYPIMLSVDDLGADFALTIDADRRIDPHRVMGYVHAAARSLVEALESQPDTLAMKLETLPESERIQVLERFNATQHPYPADTLIHELFEEQVRRTPHALAVTDAQGALTYDQLNSRANQLAHLLVSLGVGPDQLVGVCLERNLNILVALLGILKSGGAYVPLDPHYPPERLEYMLQDARPRLVLTLEALKERLPPSTMDIICLDSDWSRIAQHSADEAHARTLGLRPDHLAYVIYTSGSTGQPKGVAIEHRNTVNFLYWARSAFSPDTLGRTLQSTSLNFDLSVYECFTPLTVGGSIHVVENAMEVVKSPLDVTHINTVPSAIRGILDSGAIPETTRVVNLAGEALKGDLVELIFERSAVERVCNLYGPSETTTYSSWVSMSRAEGFNPTIGRPIANTKIYILNPNRQPVPIGVAGEIYIGGAGVARGYLRRPELTAERFIQDPFNPQGTGFLYKTGDLGKWQADGSIEYLGRNDQQVKIRGFRIELGEIEARVVQHPQVKEAAVVAREDIPGDKRLVAYLVGDRNAERAPDTAETTTARDETVNRWEALWKETYQGQDRTPEPSFVGWNSSYTGAPIPQEQMREWLSGTIGRIQALRPSKVLEIGCGVGLVLQHLAPACAKYVAMDFSSSAIERLRQWIPQRADLAHVELLQRSATELQDLEPLSFDTIVLNSVVQYFPDVDYLMAVLKEAVRLLVPGGHIFLGDIRHYGLITTFHSAVQLEKATPNTSVEQLRQRVARAVAQEKELVIDPQLFELLPQHVPGIAAASVQLKRGRAQNELIAYRYDVVLRCAQKEDHYATPVGVATVASVAELESALKDHRWTAVTLRSLHNSRLLKDGRARHLLENESGHVTAEDLRPLLSGAPTATGFDPEDIYACAEAHGYEVNISWSAGQHEGAPGCFDVQLILGKARRSAMTRPSTKVKPWDAYANDPIANSFGQTLIPAVREYLQEHLPEHMIPATWVVLKSLPLTPNGKVDRRALPAPQRRPDETTDYIAPRTELERALADIWTQILRVDRIGIQDNFFELGGHSLHGMRLVAKLTERFRVRVSVITIFQSPTIQQMAKVIEALQPAQETATDLPAIEFEEGAL